MNPLHRLAATIFAGLAAINLLQAGYCHICSAAPPAPKNLGRPRNIWARRLR